jgi:hypothetical protein
VRNAANGMTLGYGDKIAAFMDAHNPWGSGDYTSNLAAERANSQASMDRAGPIAGNVEQMAGTLLPGGAIAKGIGAAGAAAEGIPLVGRVLGNGLVQGGTTGAAIGGLSAAGNDQDIGKGALIGGALGTPGSAIGGLVGGGAQDASDYIASKSAPVRAAADMRDEASAIYNSPEMTATTLDPSAVTRLSDSVEDLQKQMRINPNARSTPLSGDIVDGLNELKANPSPSLSDIEGFRQTLNNVASAGKGGPDTAFATAAKAKFDNFSAGLTGADLTSGDISDASNLTRARTLWGSSAKLGAVDNALQQASDRAAASGSGANIDNATRQKLVALKNREAFGWSGPEKSALQQVIDGTPTGNTARGVGNVLAGHGTTATATEIALGGLGEMAMSGQVSPMTLAAGSALPVAGYAAKKLGDALTSGRVANLRATIASGGGRLAPMPSVPVIAPSVYGPTNALARALAASKGANAGPANSSGN